MTQQFDNRQTQRPSILRRLLARLGRDNYAVRRHLFVSDLIRQEQEYPLRPLLLLSMGKVGSKTVWESLKATGLPRYIHHFHHLRSSVLDKLDMLAREDLQKHLAKATYVWTCRRVEELIQQPGFDDKWKFVTLVRDPIARNLSDFFQNLAVSAIDKDTFQVSSEWHGFEQVLHTDNLQPLMEHYFDKYEHRIHDGYFDTQIKKNLGIDLMTGDFPTSKGFKIFQGRHADVLVLRLEDLQTTAGPAFSEYLHVNNFQLIRKNTTRDKEATGRLYGLLKSQIEFSQDYLDGMYESAYARQFYGPGEIEEFRQRWATCPR